MLTAEALAAHNAGTYIADDGEAALRVLLDQVCATAPAHLWRHGSRAAFSLFFLLCHSTLSHAMLRRCPLLVVHQRRRRAWPGAST